MKKEYLKGTIKLLETKLNSKNLITGMNTWAVLVRYTGTILKMDQRRISTIGPDKGKIHDDT